MAQVGQHLLPALDVVAAAERIVSAVVEIFQGGRAALYEIDAAGLVCVAAAGAGDARSWMGWRLPSGVGIAWRALAENRAVTSAEAPGTAVFPAAAAPPSPTRRPSRWWPCPSGREGQVLGVLVLGVSAQHPFGAGRDRAPHRVRRPGGADPPERPPLRQERAASARGRAPVRDREPAPSVAGGGGGRATDRRVRARGPRHPGGRDLRARPSLRDSRGGRGCRAIRGRGSGPGSCSPTPWGWSVSRCGSASRS